MWFHTKKIRRQVCLDLEPDLYVATRCHAFRSRCDVALASPIWCCVLQADEGGEWHPVSYYLSRRLRPEECNYTAMERETLAAIHALRTWKHYLYKPFQLVTDNQGVTYLKSKPELSKRGAQWVEFLADFDVEIIHCSGKQNIADTLSRLPGISPGTCASSFIPEIRNDEASFAAIQVSFQWDPKFSKRLAKICKSDKKLRHVIKPLKRSSNPQGLYQWDGDSKKLFSWWQGTAKDCAFRREVCEWTFYAFAMMLALQDTLPGIKCTQESPEIIIGRVWDGMWKDVCTHVLFVSLANETGPRQPPLQPLPVPRSPGRNSQWILLLDFKNRLWEMIPF